MACLEIRRRSTHSRVIVIYRYRRGPGLASRVSPQPVLPAIVRSSPRAWAAALCHSHGGESAPRGPTPKRLCTRPWPSLVSGQLGHLLQVGGAPHRHRRGQARPGPRALAASSEGVSQPGHPTVRDIRLLTAECLWRTSRGQAQEAGLAVSVSGKVHFKTIQEKKKNPSITYRVAPLWACVQVTPARSVERGFLSLGFGPSCHLPRFLEMPHSHGASPRAHLISQPPAAPCGRRRKWSKWSGLKAEACGPPLETLLLPAAPTSKASPPGRVP